MLVLALKFSRNIRRRAPSNRKGVLTRKIGGRTPLENGTESHASDQLGVPDHRRLAPPGQAVRLLRKEVIQPHLPVGYLVTTSPQSLIPPSTAPSLRLGHRLRVLPTFVV